MDPDIRVRVALDSDPADPAPIWTDITDRVHYGDGGGEVKATIGRQDETGEIKPTEMSWAVRNGDNAMTPNNSASPYAGRWEQGRRVQIAEVVGGQEFLLGTGFLEIPDMQIVDQKSSQPVTVTAVDWMGRLESAPPFEGTLAEHIRVNGGGLVEWWPLSESAESGVYMSALTGRVTHRTVSGWGDAAIYVDPEELIRPANVDGPPGDDQRYLECRVAGDTTSGGSSQYADAYLQAPVSVPVATTEVVAVSAWVNFGAYELAGGSAEPSAWIAALAGVGVEIALYKMYVNDTTSYAAATVFTSAVGTTTLSLGRPYERDAWRLLTVRWTLATGLVELWSAADAAVSTTVAPTVAPLQMGQIQIGQGWAGSIGHVQVRTGPAATTMTRQMHLDQYTHGYQGLGRQTVAERITTISGYAGVPATEVVVPASCSTPMQPAKLAGVGPAEAIRRAATTGQDTLITDGAGRITAVPRAQRYNQPVTMTIPFGWIGYRGLRYRPDKPVSDVTVSRTGGAGVRRSDRARAQRYGVTGQQYELDTAIDADPANLASWALAAFGQSRTRAPSIRISMLRRSIAERQALLSLKVGDRIQITGLPAGSPSDVGHLIVQGIEHSIGPGLRRDIQFNTSPLLGATAGQPPKGVMVGDLVATTAVIAY